MDPARVLTLQWLSSLRWGAEFSKSAGLGGASGGGGAPEKHNRTPRDQTQDVESVHGQGKKEEQKRV